MAYRLLVKDALSQVQVGKQQNASFGKRSAEIAAIALVVATVCFVSPSFARDAAFQEPSAVDQSSSQASGRQDFLLVNLIASAFFLLQFCAVHWASPRKQST